MLHVTRPQLPSDSAWADLLPSATASDLLRAAVTRAPGKLAVVDDRQAVTYAELAAMVRSWVALLRTRGVAPGDTVAWQLPNCVEAVALFFATREIGAVTVPVVPIFRRSEVSFICAQTKARVLVVPRDTGEGFAFEAMADEVAASLDRPDAVLPVSVGDRAAVHAAGSGNPPHRPARRDEIAAVVYTSGTESRPKGALHSEAALLYEAASMREVLGLTPDDVFFMPSPLSHITGLLNGVVTPLTMGCTVVLQTRWRAEAAVELIERFGCTYSVLATPFLQQMFALPDARHRLRSFRMVRCGGADIPATLMRAAAEVGVKVLRVYGLSEVPTVTCTRPDDTDAGAAASDGSPLPHIALRIVDDNGADVPAGVSGHVLAAGPEMFLGYADPSLNEGSFTPDGLFRTGDLGAFDEAGRLRITGRAKDIIVRGGENISALEVEEVLREHPGIADVAVVGVPDPVMGQRACAFVVSRGPRIDSAALRDFVVSAGLAIQKAPEHLVLTDELPRTAAGKVIKTALRDRFVPPRG
ncbi:class I adenylate-forming enzyme family protein [Streptomyces sp. NPDC007264]|uniref:class I adenylate-forming enzyme family protein n=1 Tax=Streptomyces sp. NPDC007264 TaxID=3364777 RepID=UPI0036D86FB8